MIAATSVGGSAIVSALGLFVILFVVASIWGSLRSHNFNGLIALVGMLATMYAGWYLRGYPGIDAKEGMLLALWHGWLDSMRLLALAFLDAIGMDSAWQRISDFWTSHFTALE
jgi:hypothetical protein